MREEIQRIPKSHELDRVFESQIRALFGIQTCMQRATEKHNDGLARYIENQNNLDARILSGLVAAERDWDEAKKQLRELVIQSNGYLCSQIPVISDLLNLDNPLAIRREAIIRPKVHQLHPHILPNGGSSSNYSHREDTFLHYTPATGSQAAPTQSFPNNSHSNPPLNCRTHRVPQPSPEIIEILSEDEDRPSPKRQRQSAKQLLRTTARPSSHQLFPRGSLSIRSRPPPPPPSLPAETVVIDLVSDEEATDSPPPTNPVPLLPNQLQSCNAPPSRGTSSSELAAIEIEDTEESASVSAYFSIASPTDTFVIESDSESAIEIFTDGERGQANRGVDSIRTSASHEEQQDGMDVMEINNSGLRVVEREGITGGRHDGPINTRSPKALKKQPSRKNFSTSYPLADQNFGSTVVTENWKFSCPTSNKLDSGRRESVYEYVMLRRQSFLRQKKLGKQNSKQPFISNSNYAAYVASNKLNQNRDKELSGLKRRQRSFNFRKSGVRYVGSREIHGPNKAYQSALCARNICSLELAASLHVASGEIGELAIAEKNRFCVAIASLANPVYNDKGTLAVCDLEKGRLRYLSGHTTKSPGAGQSLFTTVTDVKYSNNEQFIFSCGFDRCFRVFSAETGQPCRATGKHSASINRMALMPGDRNVVATCGEESETKIWVIDEHGEMDGNPLLAPTKKKRRNISCVDFINSFYTQHVVAGFEGTRSSRRGCLVFWQLTPDRLVIESELEHLLASVSCIDTTATGTYLAIGSSGGASDDSVGDEYIRIFDQSTHAEVLCFKTEQNDMNSVTISPCERYVASCGMDNRVFLFDLRKGDQPLNIFAHENPVMEIPHGGIMNAVWARGGDFLLSGGADGKVRVWHTGRQDSLVKFYDHGDDPVSYVALSQDETLLAAACTSGFLHLHTNNSGILHEFSKDLQYEYFF
ncbi:uncharacterized protein VTP21DRAFT_8089 [Calcarisporiella thermophila]|uniref:uncharacterized protein n=1 Tax=Calcarisporiella thermophila TaxID=911321 RepID=UPI003744821E